MQNVKHNKKYGILFGAVVFFAILIAAICLPHAAMAADSDFAESPYLYLKYEDNGTEVDGNELEAGVTYDVSFVLEGVTKLSVVQVTASVALDAEDAPLATVASAPNAGSLLSDSNSNMTSMGYVLDGNNIVFGFVSNESSYTSVSSDGVVLATVQMTFAEDCDAEDVITISENPNMTFVQSVYAANNNYDDSYALVSTYANYSGTLYPMTKDVSPDLGFNVSGSVVIMTKSDGTTSNNAVVGEYTLDVYSDSNHSDLVTSVNTVESVDSNNVRTNTFTIEGLRAGTYYAVLSGEYAISRDDITIIVSDSDLTGSIIPIICCNFNKDTVLTGADALNVYAAVASASTDQAFNLNGDTVLTGADALVVYAVAGTPTYPAIVIE